MISSVDSDDKNVVVYMKLLPVQLPHM